MPQLRSNALSQRWNSNILCSEASQQLQKLQFLISMLECQQFLFLEAGSDVKAIVLMEDRSLNQMIDIFDDKLVI